MSATGGAVTIDSVVSGSGTTTPKLGLSRSIANGETVTISYNPATGATTDVSGNELAEIAGAAVTNNVEAESAFLPSDLAGTIYFDNTERTFNGSNFIDTSTNNDFIITTGTARIWVKMAIDDGIRPSGSTQMMWGSRASDGATTSCFLGAVIDGKLRLNRRINADTTNVILSDGQNTKKTFSIRLQTANNTGKLYIDGEFIEDLTIGAVPASHANNIYYGAYNTNGTAANFMIGTGYGLYIWQGASDMSEGDIEKVDNYFASL
jgi:hypothetical protein